MVPLRKRQKDIEILLLHFLEQLGKQMGKDIIGVDDRVLKLVKTYSWPGNIRELQNAVERALHLADGPVLLPEYLPEEITQVLGKSSFQSENELSAVEDYEKQVILRLLEENKGNLTRVAARLNIARTTLYRRMDKYGLRK